MCVSIYLCNYYDTSRKRMSWAEQRDTKGDSNKGTADVHCIFIILINFIWVQPTHTHTHTHTRSMCFNAILANISMAECAAHWHFGSWSTIVLVSDFWYPIVIRGIQMCIYIITIYIYVCILRLFIQESVLVEQLRAMQMLLINAQRQQINAIW